MPSDNVQFVNRTKSKPLKLETMIETLFFNNLKKLSHFAMWQNLICFICTHPYHPGLKGQDLMFDF